MPIVKGGIEGEFEGRVYPFVVGLKAGPRTLHYLGEGTKWTIDGTFVTFHEPDGKGGSNILTVPIENVAFVGTPMFLAEKPTS